MRKSSSTACSREVCLAATEGHQDTSPNRFVLKSGCREELPSIGNQTILPIKWSLLSAVQPSNFYHEKSLLLPPNGLRGLPIDHPVLGSSPLGKGKTLNSLSTFLNRYYRRLFGYHHILRDNPSNIPASCSSWQDKAR